MVGTSIPMREFLLWSNCPNHCQFCWQKKLNKPETYLTEEEKLQSIAAVKNTIEDMEFSDILFVGGEVYCTHSPEVNLALKDLFEYTATRIKEDKTRYLYANTNMIYEDTTVLEYLIQAFEGIEDRLRLTTSYDIHGRYATEDDRTLFLKNLDMVHERYPLVNTVVNTILTKQACEAIITGVFSIKQFIGVHHITTINLLPYIPIEYGDELTPSWSMIQQTLIHVNNENPNYLVNYINQIGWEQPRKLMEYHKDGTLVECTAKYASCGHNVNFKKVLNDEECYVCRVQRLMGRTIFEVVSDEKIQSYLDSGCKVVTVGDMCSSYVWVNFRQPDVLIFDNLPKVEEFQPIIPMLRETNTKRIIINNRKGILSLDDEKVIKRAIVNNTEPVAIQTVEEEDEALYTCLVYAPKDWIILAGDPKKKCIICYGPVILPVENQ